MTSGNKPVFILTGMHRSGTSLMGRFLSHAGIKMGDRLLAASSGNPHGYYEDEEMLAFHKSVLKRTCSPLDFYCMWPRVLPEITDEDRRRAEALIAVREKEQAPWGWKDPRTSLLLEFWSKMLPAANFLLVFREPMLVVNSQARRQKKFILDRAANNRYLKGWLVYNQEILRFYMKNRDRAMLFYLDAALRDPDGFAGRLRERFHYPFTAEHIRSAYDKNVLSHQQGKQRWVSKALKAEAVKLFEELQGLSEV